MGIPVWKGMYVFTRNMCGRCRDGTVMYPTLPTTYWSNFDRGLT